MSQAVRRGYRDARVLVVCSLKGTFAHYLDWHRVDGHVRGQTEVIPGSYQENVLSIFG